METSYKNVMATLLTRFPGIYSVPEDYSLAKYAWAYSIIGSRVYRLTVHDNPVEELAVMHLVPVADLTNDCGYSATYVNVDKMHNGSFQLIVAVDIAQGAEVCYSYGSNICKEKSLVQYGFEADWQWPCRYHTFVKDIVPEAIIDRMPYVSVREAQVCAVILSMLMMMGTAIGMTEPARAPLVTVPVVRAEAGQDIGIKVKRSSTGWLVEEISKFGPAHNLLQVEDFIVQVNRLRIESTETRDVVQELRNAGRIVFKVHRHS
jgi:hypothetical protein